MRFVSFFILFFSFCSHASQEITVDVSTVEYTIKGSTLVLQSDAQLTISPDGVWTFRKPFVLLGGVKHYIQDNDTYNIYEGACALNKMEFARNAYDNRGDTVTSVRTEPGQKLPTLKIASNGSVTTIDTESENKSILAYVLCKPNSN